jgi:hypothetical protein
MAYMNQDRKKAIAPAVKALLAKYGVKGTLGVNNYSTLVLNIKEGALDFIGQANADNKESAEWRGDKYYEVKGYYQVNPYYAHESGNKKIAQFFKELVSVMNGKGSKIQNHNNSDIQSDYFDVGWYLNINIGQYNKPYTVVA